MTRRQPERALQRRVCHLLEISLPLTSWYTSIPGGHGRMTRLPGYQSGAPDILIISRDAPPVAIELKAGKKGTTQTQDDCHSLLRAAGAVVGVCRSVDEVIELCRSAGILIRAKVMT